MMWRITLGYIGSTDACLVLHHPIGGSKEYLIETTAWKILDRNIISGCKEGVIIDWLAQIIWDDMDGDKRLGEC